MYEIQVIVIDHQTAETMEYCSVDFNLSLSAAIKGMQSMVDAYNLLDHEK